MKFATMSLSFPRSRLVLGLALGLGLSGCMVGPDYQKPAQPLPTSFKEGADWQRAAADPQGALSSQWWLNYHDDALNGLIDRAAKANQSVIAAEAAYRLAEAQVAASRASLWPTVDAGLSASRGKNGSGSGNNLATPGTTGAGTGTSRGVTQNVNATLSASWEPDLWGEVRRGIESSKASAQASDAQLAGVRLSIASSVAIDYFSLRQLDSDVALLQQQQDIDERLLAMTQANFKQGIASNDQILVAQDDLEAVIAGLQSSQRSREQFEHALAVLVGVAPSEFTVTPLPDYVFNLPAVPPTLPSELLQRRPDVVAAERAAAAANAKIGVADAAFFPSLSLSAEGGYQHNTLAGLFELPNRVWTLGPALAETIFDGGARRAAVNEAKAAYDGQAANYRGSVLGALQNVEDNLSALNHLQKQADEFGQIYQRNQQLFASQQTQLQAGTVSEQGVLTQQLTLLLAKQNLRDTQGLLSQANVSLVESLGGGWQQDAAGATAAR
jgi:NodT family efflux transporter outer membrane factor (OMF) lipoprotein